VTKVQKIKELPRHIKEQRRPQEEKSPPKHAKLPIVDLRLKNAVNFMTASIITLVPEKKRTALQLRGGNRS
jgi:hypothetical protein